MKPELKPKNMLINVRLDEVTYNRIKEKQKVVNGKLTPFSDALRECINAEPNELYSELRTLRHDNKDIQQELKEVQQELKDVQLEVKDLSLFLVKMLPELATKQESIKGFATIAEILEMIMKCLPKN